MSIYLAHPTNETTVASVSPAIKERGLLLIRAKPCEVQVYLLPDVEQPGYSSYVKNLPAFMEAAMTMKVVPICNRGYPLPANVEHLLPWKFPNLMYDFTGKVGDALINDLKGHSVLVPGKRGNPSFSMPNPTLDKIRNLVKNNPTVNHKTAHVYGTVNLDAMRMVFVIQKLLSVFLQTHTYPAFLHENDITPNVEDLVAVVSKKRKTSDTTYVKCVTNPEDEVDKWETVTDTEIAAKPEPSSSNAIRLAYAKFPKEPKQLWGSVDDFPNASGLFIPYLKELAVSETITLPTLVSTYFMRSLAKDHATMFDTFSRLKSAWGVISGTSLGNEITHLSKCIELALQGQAAIYAVYTNSVYEGSVIFGAGYSINVLGEVRRPLTYEKLQKVVLDGSSHTQATHEIARLTHTDWEVVKDILSMRELSNLCKGVALDDVTKQSIVKAAANLCYSTRYWSTSHYNVKQALGFLLSPDVDIPDEVPMHFSHLFSSDRVELVMSAFGHMAPTFMIPNGQKCSFEMKDPPKNLLVRSIGTNTAVQDMKYMMENGYITNNLQNLSSKHRDNSFNGKEKVEIWSMIKGLWSSKLKEGTEGMVTAKSATAGGGIDTGLW